MKIDITRKEYRDLIDMLYIAEWVLNAHRLEEDPRTTRYARIEQKFLALAKRFQYADLVEYDPELEQYFPTRKYEETAVSHRFIDEYDDGRFWSMLADRLAWRDLARSVGGYDKIEKLSIEERLGRLFQFEEMYREEFQENGLDNIEFD
ncbi:MAG: hypothetical protein JSV68_10640 [Anaerolineaceae bacterium]|nr:MAG: hypothetical protein JSV68_10640 [Anaerolineaceae bacterium]